MTMTFKQACLAVWRGHTRGLHASMHGIKSADSLPLGETDFDRTSAHTRRAVEGATRGLLVELAQYNAQPVDILADALPSEGSPVSDPVNNAGNANVPREAPKPAPARGWPGDLKAEQAAAKAIPDGE